MPLFKTGGRRGGLSSSQIVVADIKTDAVDTDLASVSAADDTLASAKAIKTYIDSVA